jgi:hypothetical protein
MEAGDMSIGAEIMYSDAYVDAWENAYLEGREEYEDFVRIKEWRGVLVGLTFVAGIVTVQTKALAKEFASAKQIHIDNIETIRTGEWE